MKILKVTTAVLLILAITVSCAFAAPGKTLIKYAKNTLKCLSSGNFSAVVASLPVSGISPDESEWANFAARSLGLASGASPQTTYAVAFSIGSRWRAAVPLKTPDKGDVPVFYLDSEDGDSVCGYGCCKWSEIVSAYKSADNVVWNDEYFGGASGIEADNR